MAQSPFLETFPAPPPAAPPQDVWNLLMLAYYCIVVLASQAHHEFPFTLRQDVSIPEEMKGGDLPG